MKIGTRSRAPFIGFAIVEKFSLAPTEKDAAGMNRKRQKSWNNLKDKCRYRKSDSDDSVDPAEAKPSASIVPREPKPAEMDRKSPTKQIAIPPKKRKASEFGIDGHQQFSNDVVARFPIDLSDWRGHRVLVKQGDGYESGVIHDVNVNSSEVKIVLDNSGTEILTFDLQNSGGRHPIISDASPSLQFLIPMPPSGADCTYTLSPLLLASHNHMAAMAAHCGLPEMLQYAPESGDGESTPRSSLVEMVKHDSELSARGLPNGTSGLSVPNSGQSVFYDSNLNSAMNNGSPNSKPGVGLVAIAPKTPTAVPPKSAPPDGGPAFFQGVSNTKFPRVKTEAKIYKPRHHEQQMDTSAEDPASPIPAAAGSPVSESEGGEAPSPVSCNDGDEEEDGLESHSTCSVCSECSDGNSEARKMNCVKRKNKPPPLRVPNVLQEPSGDNPISESPRVLKRETGDDMEKVLSGVNFERKLAELPQFNPENSKVLPSSLPTSPRQLLCSYRKKRKFAHEPGSPDSPAVRTVPAVRTANDLRLFDENRFFGKDFVLDLAVHASITSDDENTPQATPRTTEMATPRTPSDPDRPSLRKTLDQRRQLVLQLLQDKGLFPTNDDIAEFHAKNMDIFPTKNMLQLKIREVRQRVMSNMATRPDAEQKAGDEAEQCGADVVVVVSQENASQ